MATGARVSVASTATAIVNYSQARQTTIKNVDGALSVFIGGSGVTALDGFELIAGATLNLGRIRRLYGITAATSVSVHVLSS